VAGSTNADADADAKIFFAVQPLYSNQPWQILPSRLNGPGKGGWGGGGSPI
jgi:hypothetical protein